MISYCISCWWHLMEHFELNSRGQCAICGRRYK